MIERDNHSDCEEVVLPAQRLRTATTTTALRRKPKQQRGQRRVEQILFHAEVAFSEMGFDQTTTNLIADRAGVSIGSLYQFFASKEAILEAMTERYLAQTLEALELKLTTTTTSDIAAIVSDLLELMIKLQERRPYFLQCLTASRPSPTLNQAVNNLSTAVAERVVVLMKRLGIKASDAVLVLRARICVETMGILLPFVVASRGKPRKLAIEEIQNLLVGYLSPMIPEETA